MITGLQGGYYIQLFHKPKKACPSHKCFTKILLKSVAHKSISLVFHHLHNVSRVNLSIDDAHILKTNMKMFSIVVVSVGRCISPCPATICGDRLASFVCGGSETESDRETCE